MDLGNDRDGRVANSTDVQLPLPLVFTVPYSNEEILLLNDTVGEGLGVVYNPRKMASPIPWKAYCAHCVRGQQVGLDITIKRAIKVLCSRKMQGGIEIYTIPTNNEPCTVWCKRDNTGLIVKILSLEEDPIDAIWTGQKFITQRKSPAIHSKLVERSLKLIGSVRQSSVREVKASLMPLLEQQRRDGIATHRRFPCLKIDWATVLVNAP